MSEPLVSVIIPTANRAPLLERSLKGIVAQKYGNLEILIGDNASTDGTEALCRHLAQADPRIHYIRRESNIGIYPNHNDLIDKSRGELICFLHDDDEFDPSLIREEVLFLQQHPEAGLVAPDWSLIDEEGKQIGLRDHAVPEILEGTAFIERTLRSGQSSVGLSGTMVRRSALGTSRFDAEGPIGFADFVLWFEVAERAKVGHIAKRLYAYRLHTRSLSRRSVISISRDYRESMDRFCDAHLRRYPSDGETVRRWRGMIQRYLFWMLAYEICLHFSRRLQPGREERYKTVFELMDYRLTGEEFKQALSEFRSLDAGQAEAMARHAINFFLATRWTWPLGRIAPHAPAFRGLLRLQ